MKRQPRNRIERRPVPPCTDCPEKKRIPDDIFTNEAQGRALWRHATIGLMSIIDMMQQYANEGVPGFVPDNFDKVQSKFSEIKATVNGNKNSQVPHA